MKSLSIKTNPEVEPIFENYPDPVRKKMLELRKLILETAGEAEGITDIEETLKWGEPSFLVKKGSTIRIDWKKRKPDQYALYFQCTSRLVPTFRTIYNDILEFEGNRAIVLKLGDKIPEKELKHCISMALSYHKIKHLPLLGA